MKNIDKWLYLLPQKTIKKLVEIQKNINKLEKQGKTIYPSFTNRYKALELIDPKDVKVVILGQDPYHGENQAIGLSFSVNKGVKIPPSLQNIFKELVSDLNIKMPSSGDLTPWAKEGVLLLNASLSVEKGKPNSHKDLGWHEITREIIKQTLLFDQPIVYLCWGRFAENSIMQAEAEITMNGKKVKGKKTVLSSTHPSPYSAMKPATNLDAFIGSKPFSRANHILIHDGAKPVNWELP